MVATERMTRLMAERGHERVLVRELRGIDPEEARVFVDAAEPRHDAVRGGRLDLDGHLLLEPRVAEDARGERANAAPIR